MLQLFMDKQFIPVLASAITVLLILLTRPGFLVRSSDNKNCPYCLNAWLVTLVVLAVGGITYAVVNEDAAKPRLPVYN
jgi:hypothetical protein